MSHESSEQKKEIKDVRYLFFFYLANDWRWMFPYHATDILLKESSVKQRLIVDRESRTIFFKRLYRVESGLAIAAIRIPCTRSMRH